MYSVRILYGIARRYRRRLLIAGLVATICCLIYESLLPRQYTATAAVSLRSEQTNSQDAHLKFTADASTFSLKAVLNQLSEQEGSEDMYWWKEFAPELEQYYRSNTANVIPALALSEEEIRKETLSLVHLSLDEHGQSIQIKVTTSEPMLSAQLANAFARSAVQLSGTLRTSKEDESLQYLRTKVQDTLGKVQNAKQQLAELDDAHAAWFEHEYLENQLEDLNRKLSVLLEERIELQAAASSKEARSARMLSSPLADRIRAQLIEIDLELTTLRKTLGPKHPQIKDLQAERRKLQDILHSGEHLQSDMLPTLIAALDSQEQSLRTAIADGRKKLQQLSLAASRYEAVQAELTSMQKAHQWWTTQLAYSETNLGIVASPTFVSLPANVPTAPNQPFDWWFVTSGFLFGIATALFFQAVRISGSQRFYSLEHAERYLRSTALTSIPELSHTILPTPPRPLYNQLPHGQPSVDQFFADHDEQAALPGGIKADEDIIQLLPEMIIDFPDVAPDTRQHDLEQPFRELRGELMLQLPKGNSVLTVTSALHGEGTSTICSNLAQTLAKAGFQTLLIDANVSFRPGAELLPGLAEYLHSIKSPREIVYQSSVPQLYTVPAGNAGPDTVDLLCSRRLSLFLEKVRALFDFVILDAPPIMQRNETLLLAERSDNILFVVDNRQNDPRLCRLALERLKQTNVSLAGIVLNRAPLHADQAAGRPIYKTAA